MNYFETTFGGQRATAQLISAGVLASWRGSSLLHLALAALITLLIYWAAAGADKGERVDMQAGMAKLFASEVAVEVSLDAMRIHGGYGYSKEYEIERLYRDAPLLLIGEGTSEIQRMVIGKKLLQRHKL